MLHAQIHECAFISQYLTIVCGSQNSTALVCAHASVLYMLVCHEPQCLLIQTCDMHALQSISGVWTFENRIACHLVHAVGPTTLKRAIGEGPDHHIMPCLSAYVCLKLSNGMLHCRRCVQADMPWPCIAVLPDKINVGLVQQTHTEAAWVLQLIIA